jgi:hypothetical protein
MSLTTAAGSVASTKSTRCQKASPLKTRQYHVFDEITKKPVNFNIATLNFPERQKTQNSPPKMKEARKPDSCLIGGWEVLLEGIRIKLGQR